MPDDGDAQIIEKITLSLMRVINKIEQGRRVARSYGPGLSLTRVEIEVCALIFRNDGITGSELSGLLGVTRSATSQIVSKLKAKELVSENYAPGAAKRKHLHLSDRGRDAARIAGQYQSAMAAALFGSADTAELHGYLDFINRLDRCHTEAIAAWETSGGPDFGAPR